MSQKVATKLPDGKVQKFEYNAGDWAFYERQSNISNFNLTVSAEIVLIV